MSTARCRLSRNDHALVAVAVSLVLAACDRRATWPPAAVDADLGHDACASCRMIVSDARFAAQYHERGGPVEFFDDLGCLLAAHAGESCDAQATFVRSFDDTCWLRGDEAYVVRAAAFTSPMGFGFAAFATRPAAETEARARADARAFDLATLLRQDRNAIGLPGAGVRDGSQGDHP